MPHLATQRGLDGIVQLLKEKEVWQEGGINLAGLQVKSASLKEANEALLHRFGFLDDFQPVIDATPFTMDDEIMDNMVLKELHMLPSGYRTLFPFDCNRLATNLADLQCLH